MLVLLLQRWDCRRLWTSWSLWGPSSYQKGRASIWGWTSLGCLCCRLPSTQGHRRLPGAHCSLPVRRVSIFTSLKLAAHRAAAKVTQLVLCGMAWLALRTQHDLSLAQCSAFMSTCPCRHEALLLLLRQDIWGALAMAACRPNLAALSHACQVRRLSHLCHTFRIDNALSHFRGC